MFKVLSERRAGCNLHKAISMHAISRQKILNLYFTWCRESNPGLLHILNFSLGLTAGHSHL